MSLIDMIKMHEGKVMENGRHMPYPCPAGKQTIGYGRNIEDRGLSEQEAQTLLWNDVELVTKQLDVNLPFFNDLSENRRYALIDMCFNLGLTRFMKFKKMLIAFECGEYNEAADEALDSKWARQVTSRAQRDAKMIREG